MCRAKVSARTCHFYNQVESKYFNYTLCKIFLMKFHHVTLSNPECALTYIASTNIANIHMMLSFAHCGIRLLDGKGTVEELHQFTAR